LNIKFKISIPTPAIQPKINDCTTTTKPGDGRKKPPSLKGMFSILHLPYPMMKETKMLEKNKYTI